MAAGSICRIDSRGAGHVASCAIDSEGYLAGMAYVEKQANVAGTPIGIFVLPERPAPEKPKPELAEGDRVLMPVEVTILSRFPLKAKQARRAAAQ